ncbi:HEAT repeat domain-containing protein [Dactylosporangium sp. CA-139066]|uniref:HEAT repeat domain-containing protein n=1 Tax=Dactylosporangium sp. CA-139066 TaxID=3239930 RepID=UPI003D8F0C9D
MGRRQDHAAVLRELPPPAWPAHLLDGSGLPGPRADLELAQAAADVAAPETVDALLDTGEEYLVLCGVIGLGRLLAEGTPGTADRLRRYATDGRWRVREGVAMALQRLGDADPPRLYALVRDWAGDPHPLVQRAAVAGLCEPRLLRPPGAAAEAVAACATVTGAFAARPAATRRDEDVRALRKALGYCWSVAVAADRAAGMPVFERYAALADPDVAWIARENRGKARMR